MNLDRAVDKEGKTVDFDRDREVLIEVRQIKYLKQYRRAKSPSDKTNHQTHDGF